MARAEGQSLRGPYRDEPPRTRGASPEPQANGTAAGADVKVRAIDFKNTADTASWADAHRSIVAIWGAEGQANESTK